MRRRVASWRHLESRTRSWTGGWLGVHTLGGGPRAARRRSERALRFLGLEALSPGLSLRPDNLAEGVADQRGRRCWARFLGRYGVPRLRAPADTRIAEGAGRLLPALGGAR